MKKLEVKSFSNSDEVRKFDKGKIELIKVGGAMRLEVVRIGQAHSKDRKLSGPSFSVSGL